jgi:phage tail sheath protein FI
LTNAVARRRNAYVVRTQAMELIRRSPALAALAVAQRKNTLTNSIAVLRFLADGDGITAQLGLRLVEVRDGTAVAASMINQVDFPGFVAGLIQGVFQSIVTASIEQMAAYGELVATVAAKADEFMRDYADQSDDYLTDRWPQWFSKQPGQSLQFQADRKSAALKEILSTLVPESLFTRPNLASVRKAARKVLVFERQQAILNEFGEALQHIVAHNRDSATRFELVRAVVSYPGVYVEEIFTGVRPIPGVSTSTTGFVGLTARRKTDEAVKLVTSWHDFEREFGGIFEPSPQQQGHQFLPHAVQGFFANGGTRAMIAAIDLAPGETITDANYIGANDPPSGLAALAQRDDISILVAPGVTSPGVQQAMVAQCETRRDRIALLDLPLDFALPGTVRLPNTSYAAAYWPWLTTDHAVVPPSGFIAGQYARLPAHRAPRSDIVAGATGLSQAINDHEQARLSELRINSLRIFPGRVGPVAWGVRSLSEDPEWRYLFMRRYGIYLEQSIARGLSWAVFEPNAPALWRQATNHVADFLYAEWCNGGLVGVKPEQAFFVKCDRSTMTQSDIESGRLVIIIGFAPIKPAEFVIIRIGLWAAH